METRATAGGFSFLSPARCRIRREVSQSLAHRPAHRSSKGPPCGCAVGSGAFPGTSSPACRRGFCVCWTACAPTSRSLRSCRHSMGERRSTSEKQSIFSGLRSRWMTFMRCMC